MKNSHFAQQDQEQFRMRFGWFPGVPENIHDATSYLEILQENTLYKDIFIMDEIRKPKVLQDLVIQLAFRIGSVISVQSLASEIKTTAKTIERYIDLLEKSFVIVRIYAFSRNPGNERKKGYKIYFIDIGMRNSIIKDHKEFSFRNDVGAVFENYFIMERVKFLSNHRKYVNSYFWQNYRQEEVDYIEQSNGELRAYECKFTHRVSKSLQLFALEYPSALAHTVSSQNYGQFIS